MIQRGWTRSGIGAFMIALALVFAAISPVAAGTGSGNGANASVDYTPPPHWGDLKAALNSDPDLTRITSVAGGTRTVTYTSTSTGMTLVLSEPAGGEHGSVQPRLGVGGCGWFDLCIYLNRTDQGALAAGAAAALAIAICAIPAVGWVGCAAVAGALAAAAYYIAAYGFCPRNLQVGLLPPGRDLACTS